MPSEIDSSALTALKSVGGDTSASRTHTCSPLLWLNVPCLDAPIVAVSWQWLFSHTFHTHFTAPACVALFLTAWFIYLCDRVADSLTIGANIPASARQRFCLKHRIVMFGCAVVVSTIDAALTLTRIDRQTFLFAAAIGGVIFAYLAINHVAPLIWKKFPLKEISIGILFALGTVAAVRSGRVAFVAGVTLFALLCSLNCLSISFWERSLDLTQGRVSFATVLPRLGFVPQFGCWIAAAGGLAVACYPILRALGLCVASSAFLLLLLNRAEWLARDERVAAADLVLLTPLVYWIGLWSLH